MLESMAASSASTVCPEAKEVLGWFADPAQKRAVFETYTKARAATGQHPDAWARAEWERASTDIRAVMQEPALADVAYEMICDQLERHSKRLEEKPSTHQPLGWKYFFLSTKAQSLS